MMNTKTSLALIVLLTLAAQDASAYVNFDDFQVNLLDHRLNAGDTLQVILRFKNPDRNRSVDADIEILLNDTAIFRDEGYRIDFVEGQDKTVTITSNDFPGPDLDDDYYDQNLMDYECGSYNVTVRVSGADFKNDLEEGDTFALGGNDRPLDIRISPDNPSVDGSTTVTAYDDHKKELEGMSVKLTWIDDPKGSEMGRWDSEDQKTAKQTNSDGEAKFNISQKFAKNACGQFQVDAYGDRYCLARKSFGVGMQKLFIGVSPERLMTGQAATVCAKGSDGGGISQVAIHVMGPGYSETHQTGQDGCLNLTLQTAGDYIISADKTCYEADGEKHLTVGAEAATASASGNVSLRSMVANLLNYSLGAKTNATSTTATGEPAPAGNAVTYLSSLPDKLSEMVSGDSGTLKALLCIVALIAIVLLLKNIVKK